MQQPSRRRAPLPPARAPSSRTPRPTDKIVQNAARAQQRLVAQEVEDRRRRERREKRAEVEADAPRRKIKRQNVTVSDDEGGEALQAAFTTRAIPLKPRAPTFANLVQRATKFPVVRVPRLKDRDSRQTTQTSHRDNPSASAGTRKPEYNRDERDTDLILDMDVEYEEDGVYLDEPQTKDSDIQNAFGMEYGHDGNNEGENDNDGYVYANREDEYEHGDGESAIGDEAYEDRYEEDDNGDYNEQLQQPYSTCDGEVVDMDSQDEDMPDDNSSQGLTSKTASTSRPTAAANSPATSKSTTNMNPRSASATPAKLRKATSFAPTTSALPSKSAPPSKSALAPSKFTSASAAPKQSISSNAAANSASAPTSPPRRAVRVRKEQSKPCESDFDEDAQAVLKYAIPLFQAEIITRNAFVDDTDTLLKAMKSAWTIGCRMADVELLITSDVTRLLRSRITRIRQDFINAAKNVVGSHYGFKSGQEKKIVRRNRRRHEQAVDDDRYIYKNPAFGHDITERSGIYGHGAIQDVLNQAIFRDKKDLGIRHCDILNPISCYVLALILTALRCALDEYATGTKEKNKFSAQTYKTIYDAHVCNINKFASADEAKKHDLMGKILGKLTKNGRCHAGVEAVLGPAAVYSDETVQAAIRDMVDNVDVSSDPESGEELE